MMRFLLLSVLTLGAVAAMTDDAQAFGRRNKGGCGSSMSYSSGSSCGGCGGGMSYGSPCGSSYGGSYGSYPGSYSSYPGTYGGYPGSYPGTYGGYPGGATMMPGAGGTAVPGGIIPGTMPRK